MWKYESLILILSGVQVPSGVVAVSGAKNAANKMADTTLGDIDRVMKLGLLAREEDLRRDNLYKIFSPEGDPGFAAVLKVVVRTLGLRLHATAGDAEVAFHQAVSVAKLQKVQSLTGAL
jgi:probable addiction module antidote protein